MSSRSGGGPISDALSRAEELRLAGRWEEVVALLDEARPAAKGAGPADEARVLTAIASATNDRDLFGGIESPAGIRTILDEATELAERTGDLAILGSVWDVRGMSLHTGFLRDRGSESAGELEAFERALRLRREARDVPAVAESLFHVALVHQVVRGDGRAAAPLLEESYALARTSGDPITMSYAIRHLAFVRWEAGLLEAAQDGLEESLRLREESGFVPGAAMARVALAEFLAEAGDPAAARSHLAHAAAVFELLGAETRVTWVEEALLRLGDGSA